MEKNKAQNELVFFSEGNNVEFLVHFPPIVGVI